jgi:sulfur carrier protein
MIELIINGKRVELDQPTPLLSYLEKLGVNPRTVAVEHNGEIIERSTFASTTLREGDKVEIVRMVGGGWSQQYRTS